MKGRKLLPRWKRKHQEPIHLTKNDIGWSDGYTLCGLRIYGATIHGIRMLLAFPMTLKDEHGVCKNCERVRDKLKNNSVHGAHRQ